MATRMNFRVISSATPEGNNHIQTHLVKSVKHGILQHRRSLQNSLVSTLAQDVQTYRVVDGHFDAKKRDLIRAVDSTKRLLNEKESYYTQRSFLAMDMAYTKILHTLGEMERVLMEELHDVHVEEDHVIAEVKRVQERMNTRRNEFLFFKNLYN